MIKNENAPSAAEPACCRDIAAQIGVVLNETTVHLLCVAGEQPANPELDIQPNGNLEELRRNLDEALRLAGDVRDLAQDIRNRV